MSKVMTTNKVNVVYAFTPEFIGRHWVKTGQFIGYGREVELDCDTQERRALIVALDWHEEDPYIRPPNLHILGKARSDLDEFYGHRMDTGYGHELTVDEIWAEIKRMVSERNNTEKEAGHGSSA